MNEQDVLQKLNTAVTHATPNQLDDILSRCTERKGTVIPMTNHKPKSIGCAMPLQLVCPLSSLAPQQVDSSCTRPEPLHPWYPWM